MIFRKIYFRCVINIFKTISAPPQKILKPILQTIINGAFLSKKFLT